MKLDSIITGAFAGLGMLTLATGASATSVGGASFSVSNGMLALTAATGGAYDINISGDFLAETLISDLNEVRPWNASLTLNADGATLLDGTLPLPPVSINGVLGSPEDEFSLISFLTPIFSTASGTVDFLDPPVTYDVTDIVRTGNSIAGHFELSTVLTTDILDDIGEVFGLGTGITLPESIGFSLTAEISPVGPETSPVPVPAALPLALSGMALLGGLGFRRKRSRA